MHLAFDPALALILTAGSAIATALLIQLLRPWLLRYALARPNARSSHTVPTPQGGGIAIVVVLAVVIAGAGWLSPQWANARWTVSLFAALTALAVAGAVDDILPLPVLPRLAVQVAAGSLLVLSLPVESRLLPLLPLPAERALLVVALVWFTNLTNFMDGIDWMTVVEVVPIGAALAIVGMLGIVREMHALLPILLALLGAMIGFAPFNRHIAKLFLGDVGSLPVGALLGWLLIVLAAGHPIAALILPLYYLADATITLLRRALRGENIAVAHRGHFYQIAIARGFSVPQVTCAVLVLNVLLAALAIASILTVQPLYRYLCLAAAVILTSVLLWRFERGR